MLELSTAHVDECNLFVEFVGNKIYICMYIALKMYGVNKVTNFNRSQL